MMLFFAFLHTGSHGLTACVPTGAKTGVSRSPCGVVKIPVRARLFLAVMVNSNIGLISGDGNSEIFAIYISYWKKYQCATLSHQRTSKYPLAAWDEHHLPKSQQQRFQPSPMTNSTSKALPL